MLNRAPALISRDEILSTVDEGETPVELLPLEKEYRELLKKFTLDRLCY
jgi:hypothetical protein